jgi:hypothetical protein
MKSLRLVFFIYLLVCSFNFTKAQETKDAVSYLEYIGNQFTTISNDMMSYTSAASHGKSARKVDKRRTELIQTVKEAELNMKKLKPFKGDAVLRDTVASYFRMMRLILNEDYAKIVNLEEVAEQSFDQMEAYMLAKERAEDKLDQALEKAQNQYQIFAQNNKIHLIEGSSKLSEKMKQTNKVMKYYNIIYLIFFKSFKDEVYLVDAQNRGDISAIEQTKNALHTSVQEGWKKLSPIGAFESDKSLKAACEKVLNFCQYEASDKTNELSDFYLKKEKFEKAKKAMDAKRNRSQDDVDNYNKLVKEFNDSTNKFNQLNADLNKRRNEALNTWNKASSDFLDNHIPKHRG